MNYNADQWYEAFTYMEECTGQGAFDDLPLKDLKELYARCSREFATRKRLAKKGTVYRGWNDEYAENLDAYEWRSTFNGEQGVKRND